MTREENAAVKREANRKDYLHRRSKVLAYMAQYAREHREHINLMQRERRRKKALGIWQTEKEYERPSSEAFEAELPLRLQANIQRLRQEYLNIPIVRRPVYDYWLRCKTIEHCRAIMLEKRKYDHPDIIQPKEL